MTAKKQWKCKQLERNTFELRAPLIRSKKWEFWVLAASDIHLDSIHCNRKLLTKHLQQALERDAAIIMPGDILDCLQGVGDKRASKRELASYLNVDNYWDKLVESAADFFAPYSSHIAVISEGNHEHSVKQYHETDLLQRLIGHLNITTKSGIFFGLYSGWLKIVFDESVSSKMVLLNYHHGTGYTKQNAFTKRGAYHPDADIMLFGDKHVRWKDWADRKRITVTGKVYQDQQLLLGMPGYKDEDGDGSGTYANRKGFKPTHQGAWWIRFHWDTADKALRYEAIEAG